MKSWFAISAAVVSGAFFGAPTTSVASGVLSFSEGGGNVVAELSGSINLTGASFTAIQSGFNFSYIQPNIGFIASDDGIASETYLFNITGPNQFGSGGLTNSSSNTTNINFVLCPSPTCGSGLFDTPISSDDLALSGAMTFLGQSFNSLGLQPGTYTYTFSNEETFTIQIGTTPLPSALPLFGTGLGALGLLGWRRKKKAAALPPKADMCSARHHIR